MVISAFLTVFKLHFNSMKSFISMFLSQACTSVSDSRTEDNSTKQHKKLVFLGWSLPCDVALQHCRSALIVYRPLSEQGQAVVVHSCVFRRCAILFLKPCLAISVTVTQGAMKYSCGVLVGTVT